MQKNKLHEQDHLNELMQKIDAHMMASRYVPALQLALDTLKTYPNESDIHAAAAFCYTELRYFRKARKHIQIALALGPDQYLAHYANARWYMRKNKFRQAEKLMLELCQQYPSLQNQIELFIFYKTMYGVKCYVIKRYGTLKKIRAKILALTETVATRFNAPLIAAKLKAEFYMYIKADKLTHQAAEECIATDPSDPWGYFVKTYAYLLNYKPSLAKRFLQDGLRLKPDDAWGLHLLAIIKAKAIPEYRNLFTRYLFKLGYWLVIIPVLLLAIGAGVPPLLAGAISYALGYGWKRMRVTKAAKALATLELKKDF